MSAVVVTRPGPVLRVSVQGRGVRVVGVRGAQGPQGPQGEQGDAGSSFANQAANTVFAGPSSGANAQPAFRALVVGDIPDLSSVYAAVSHAHSFASLTGKPTTLAGYGITDAYPLTGNPAGFLTANQTITLSGDVSGSGATSIAVTIGDGKVTNAMLAGSIANAKLTNSAITIAGASTSLGGSITASAILDSLSTTQGAVLYRGATGWVALGPGTSGQVLQSGGTGANVSWANAGSSGANTALGNLATVSINASLIPQTTLNLGAQSTPWRELWLYGSGTFGSHSLRFTGTPTAHRVVTFPDASITVARTDAAQTFSGTQTFAQVAVVVAGEGNSATCSVAAGSASGFFRAYGTTFGVSSLANSAAFGPDGGANRIVIFSNSNLPNGSVGVISLRGGGYDTAAEKIYINKDGIIVRAVDAVTAAMTTHAIFQHDLSSGTAAAGHGGQVLYRGASTASTGQDMAALDWQWVVATHASRTSRVRLSAYDSGGQREGVRIEGSGSAALIGFLGANAVARQSIGAAATDAASTQTLVNNIRTALINLGLCTT